MSAVLLAVFNDYEAADQARLELVRDGFPTDRVELTAAREPGRAGIEPALSLHDKFAQYFRTLLSSENERDYVEVLANRVEGGAATITVHPRGWVETERATEILEHSEPVEVVRHDLANQAMEYAAAPHDGPWIRHIWLEADHDADCIYCRLLGPSHG